MKLFQGASISIDATDEMTTSSSTRSIVLVNMSHLAIQVTGDTQGDMFTLPPFSNRPKNVNPSQRIEFKIIAPTITASQQQNEYIEVDQSDSTVNETGVQPLAMIPVYTTDVQLTGTSSVSIDSNQNTVNVGNTPNVNITGGTVDATIQNAQITTQLVDVSNSGYSNPVTQLNKLFLGATSSLSVPVNTTTTLTIPSGGLVQKYTSMDIEGTLNFSGNGSVIFIVDGNVTIGANGLISSKGNGGKRIPDNQIQVTLGSWLANTLNIPSAGGGGGGGSGYCGNAGNLSGGQGGGGGYGNTLTSGGYCGNGTEGGNPTGGAQASYYGGGQGGSGGNGANGSTASTPGAPGKSQTGTLGTGVATPGIGDSNGGNGGAFTTSGYAGGGGGGGGGGWAAGGGGGAGGDAYPSGYAGANGGNGGATIIIIAKGSISYSGTGTAIDSSGQNGANSQMTSNANASYGGGGGGGGGGNIILVSGSTINLTSSNVNNSGGTGGTSYTQSYTKAGQGGYGAYVTYPNTAF